MSLESMKQKYYDYRRDSRNVWVRCRACREKIMFERLEEHTLKAHQVNALHECPYCLSGFKWERGQKTRVRKNIEHLWTCLKAFMTDCRVPVLEETASGPSLLVKNDQRPAAVMCEECLKFRPNPRQMNGRSRDPTHELVGLYDSHFEKPDWWKTDLKWFDETRGMYDDIIGMLRRISLPEQDPEHLKFYHLMVRHDVFDTFVKAMEKIKDEIALLPYGCLCDGLGPDRITHRHMILACTLESRFEDVWKNEVRYPLKMKGTRCKNSVRIKNAFHLANCIQYVSQEKASCDGVLIRDELNENKVKSSHYDLLKPVILHGLATMCLLFEGGMEKLLTQQNFRKNVVNWVDEATKVHRQWAVAVKETGFKYLNCVIPLRRELEPTNEKTPWQLYWMKHRPLYLKENGELKSLSEEEWFKYQVRKGNTFQTIAEEMYVYGRNQQNVMNQLTEREKVLKRKWDAEKEELNESMDEKFKKQKIENDILKQENDELKREREDWNRERDDWKRQLEALQHKLEVNELKQELEAVKRELAEVKRENNDLKRELGAMKQKLETVERENAELRRELVAVKEENAELRRELVAVKEENVELRRENNDLKQKLEAVERENNDLKQKLQKLEAVERERDDLKRELEELKHAMGEKNSRKRKK